MLEVVPFQEEFRQGLPNVTGNVDYEQFRDILERIAELIKQSKIEQGVMLDALRQSQQDYDCSRQAGGKKPKELKARAKMRIQKMARQALRCGIARHLTGEAYRVFSCRLADSAVLQKFCLIDRLVAIKVPSKSQLQRYEGMFGEEFLRQIISQVIGKASELPTAEGYVQALGLEKPVSLKEYFVDTTCLEANIHYPVDWTLLRDATRTLMKAVRLIRQEGLKNRMQEPAVFIRQMNRLSIEMTHARRQKDGKRARKKVFRSMKKLIKKVAGHAQVHGEMLKSSWDQTTLSEQEAKQIIKRIDAVLEQLPQAVYQAHERIIGDRQVGNSQKILSLYEREIHVIVRGKAGAETEFGNTLLVGEQRDGIILDWNLYEEQAPADVKLLPESLERIGKYYQSHPGAVTGDRGFDSAFNRGYLGKNVIENNICPKSVEALREKLQKETFCEAQKRRGQTEGRIGIIKNVFLGSPLRSKGFSSRQMSVAWAVLSHNLWVIARLPQAQQQDQGQQQAA
jgi:hypothetical protein